MTAAPPAVVFSDLDGTLLDHHTYDWAPAAPVIAALADRGIPLVLTSSKTRREIEAWRRRLGNTAPFISENGGALWVPVGFFPRAPAAAEVVDGYWRVGLGVPYARLRAALPLLAERAGVALRGFGDMDTAQVAEATGMQPDEVADARARDYDEPFAPDRPLLQDEGRRLARAAVDLGLRIARGGRFYHVSGPVSKASAARRLLEAWGPIALVVAAGDGPNDLELLALADRAVIVARPDGTCHPDLVASLPGARCTRRPGPAGFAEGVMAALEERTS